MPICPKCHKSCKTAQGLSGHMRFRHQMTVPKQSLPLYAQRRLERAEAESARLREQVQRLERRREDLEAFYEKRMAEQKASIEGAQERKFGEQLEVLLKQLEEQNRSMHTFAQERAALLKQAQDLQKRIEALERQGAKPNELEKRVEKIEGERARPWQVEELRSELERAKADLRREIGPARGSSPLPPAPHPLRPLSSLREFRRWLFRRDEEEDLY